MKLRIKQYAKIYFVTLILVVIFDSVGTLQFDVGAGQVVILPMVFLIIAGSILGPQVLKFFTKEESELGGSLVLITLAPFMAKMGISAGANLSKLVAVGPALLLQEFGNLATILFSLPLALLLGLGKEAIGACYSINRDSNLALTTDIYGPDAPETKGTFGVYIVGSVVGTIFIGLLSSIVASWNIFHPLALGMASGVGSGVMMSASTGTLGRIYPDFAEDIILMGGVSDMLTGITGIYMAVFVALPFTKWLSSILEPKIGIEARAARKAKRTLAKGEVK